MQKTKIFNCTKLALCIALAILLVVSVALALTFTPNAKAETVTVSNTRDSNLLEYASVEAPTTAILLENEVATISSNDKFTLSTASPSYDGWDAQVMYMRDRAYSDGMVSFKFGFDQQNSGYYVTIVLSHTPNMTISQLSQYCSDCYMNEDYYFNIYEDYSGQDADDGIIAKFSIEAMLVSGEFSYSNPNVYAYVYTTDRQGNCETMAYMPLGTITWFGDPLPATPTKTGYTFTGWYTNESCTNLYTEDYILGDVTLYAGWRAHTYTIVFNGNGNVSGSTLSQAMTYDVAQNLTANGFIKNYYAFAGWSTTANGDIVYSNEQSVSNLTATNGGIVNLYAQWTALSYNVVYNANGADAGTMVSDVLTFDEQQTLQANLYTRTGYTFMGWATSSTGSVVYTDQQQVTNLATEAGETVTLYAVWAIIKCQVTFIVDGEVYLVVYVDYGTPASEVIGSAVDTVLYTTEDDYSKN